MTNSSLQDKENYGPSFGAVQNACVRNPYQSQRHRGGRRGHRDRQFGCTLEVRSTNIRATNTIANTNSIVGIQTESDGCTLSIANHPPSTTTAATTTTMSSWQPHPPISETICCSFNQDDTSSNNNTVSAIDFRNCSNHESVSTRRIASAAPEHGRTLSPSRMVRDSSVRNMMALAEDADDDDDDALLSYVALSNKSK
jgi:hypothetical protein